MSSRNSDYDLIIIGGGIYGVMLTLEASMSGLRVLLLEQKDWGAGTTYNWLRILHGGLRYLQSADLPRFYESVRERGWFLEQFPDFVKPLPCVMPLYETGSRSSLLMAAAITMNGLLSAHRNRRLSAIQALPAGGLMSKASVCSKLPFVSRDGLTKGALWYDAVVLEPQRLLMELLRWAKLHDAHAHNYSEVISVRYASGAVSGVSVRQENSGRLREFSAPVIVNATGHWSLELAGRLGIAVDRRPRLTWAWNVLFDIPSEACCAAAVTARRAGAQTFFVLPWQGRTLVGTGHATAPDNALDSAVPVPLVRQFIEDVHEAVPGLGANKARVARVFAGRLPASATGEPAELTKRPTLLDHAGQGFSGLYTVWGVKYTTARAVARKLLRGAFGKTVTEERHWQRPSAVPARLVQTGLPGRQFGSRDLDENLLSELVELAATTDVRHLDDLLLRRCGVGDFPNVAMEVARTVVGRLPWSKERKQEELDRLTAMINNSSLG